MTTRTDVVVDYSPSPRIAEVAAPSDEFIMQDVVDTLRIDEETFTGMSQPKLLNASGKEDLGGGTLVGITVALQDALIAFEARTTPAETGTVTSVPGSPIAGRQRFIDTAADFVTAGVQRGSLVINFTDQSIADVTQVIASDQLETVTLVNGIGNTYDVADVYHVFNVVQVRATGGNLTAVDSGGSPLASGVLPTSFTQVLVTSSSSATLQELEEIRLGSFQGGAWYQAGSGNSGTTYPNGNSLTPVDNFPDAVSIANANGLKNIFVISDATLDTGDDLTGFTVIGQGRRLTDFTVNAGAVVTDTAFEAATVSGTLDGNNLIEDCDVEMPSTFNGGNLVRCGIAAGTVTLGGAAKTEFIECYSDVAGLGTPTINMGGSGQSLIMRRYSGGIDIENKSGADSVSIDLVAGQILLDSTVTNGTLRLAGVGKLTDNSVGATVDSTALLNLTANAQAVWGMSTTDGSAVAGGMGEHIVKKVLSVVKFLGLK